MNKTSDLKLIFSFIISILIISKLNSQITNKYEIYGKIVDNKFITFDFSIVNLYKYSDSTKIDEVITDEDGNFKFSNLLDGLYFINVNTSKKDTIIFSKIHINKNIDLGTIKIDNYSIKLDEVTIKAYKPALKRSADHIDLNVKNSYLSKSGFDIIELLNLIPNVNSSLEGVKIKNSTGILYLIDGKGNKHINEHNYQRIINLNIQEIEKIEVYSNPPARFDADGSSVMNVITVKDLKQSSFKSTANLGLFQNIKNKETYNLYNYINLNYKIGKLGLYCYLDYSTAEEFQINQNNIYYKNLNYDLNNRKEDYNKSNGIGVKSGGVYKLNDKSEIIIDASLNLSGLNDFNKLTSNNIIIFKKNMIIDSIKNISLTNNSNSTFSNLNLGYWRKHKKNSFDIQFYYDGYNHKNSSIGYLENYVANYNKSNENNYSALCNYQDTIFKKFEIRFGLKYANTQTLENISNILNTGNFRYSENIKSAYLQFSGDFLKIKWQSGLRGEDTNWNIDIPYIKNNSYINFFPSIFLTKEFKKITINTSYTKRVQRQNLSEINPFLNIRNDILSTYSGNIDLLKPLFIDSYELNFDLQKGSISTYFNRTKNSRIYYQNSNDTLIINSVAQSVEFENTYGLSLKYPINYKKIRMNLSWNSNLINTTLLDKSINIGYSNSFALNLNVELNKNLNLSSFIVHYFKENNAYFSSNGYWKANLGFSFQNKNSPLSFKLRINDLFGRIYFIKFNYPSVNQSLTNISNERAISLSVNYNFKLGKEFNVKSFEGKSR